LTLRRSERTISADMKLSKRHPSISGTHLGGLLALATCFLCLAANGPQNAHTQPEMVPDFRCDRCFRADSLTLSDFFEYPVVLFFFDAGDVGDFPAYPYVVNWHTKYQADSLKLIGIHCPRYPPTRSWQNAITALARTILTFPVALDLDREICRSYTMSELPLLLLLEPGGKPIATASDPADYRDFETAIQSLLRRIEPDVILPFLFEPSSPKVRDTRYPPPTPRITLGYDSGSLANLDSTSFDRFGRYSDPRDRARGKVYLEGRWMVEDSLMTYEEGEAAHIRVVYSGKEVWLLPDFSLDQTVKVYVEQDRKPLPPEVWGRDIKTEPSTRTFLNTRYAIPLHIVSNPTFGTHELTIIPEEGTVSFHYLYFQGAR
jgi:hypothetical protein